MSIKKILKFIKYPVKRKVQSIRCKVLPIFRKHHYFYYGKNSDVYKPIIISNKKYIFIGNNVHIRDGARIEAISEWENQLYNPFIEIEDDVTIEQGLHLTCANHVSIGKDSMILANVMITDINHQYNGEKKLHKQGITVKETYVGESSFVGKNACIMAGVKLGKHTVVGANAVVTHDVPDYGIVAGVPAKIIGDTRRE